MLSTESQQKIEDLLLEQKVVNKKQLAELKAESTKSSRPLLGLVVDKKLIDGEALTKLIARATNVPYVNLQKAAIKPEILAMLPYDVAQQYRAVPLGDIEGKLAIGVIDPSNVQAIDFISGKMGKPVAVFMASQEGIDRILAQYKPDVAGNVQSAIAGTLENAGSQNHAVRFFNAGFYQPHGRAVDAKGL